MPANDLQLTIGVDASGVTAGLAQAKAAVADFAPKIEQLGQSASELGGQFKEGFEGIEGLGKALQAAGAKGGAGLAGLGAAGGAAVQVVTALVEVAASVAAAMADWAARTLESNTASAEAKQNAAALDEAMKGAGSAFSAVGDTIANAFAPAVTAVVSALAGLVQGFEKSYQQGGTAKMLVDDLVVAFKLLAGGVEIAVGAIVLAIESVVGETRTWVDRFQIARDAVVGGTGVIGLGFRDLGQVIHDVLSGDFGRAVSDYERGLAEIQKNTRVMVDEVGREFAQLGSDKARLGADLSGTMGRITHDNSALFAAGGVAALAGPEPAGAADPLVAPPVAAPHRDEEPLAASVSAATPPDGDRSAAADVQASSAPVAASVQDSASGARPAASAPAPSEDCPSAACVGQATSDQDTLTGLTAAGEAARTTLHEQANEAAAASDASATAQAGVNQQLRVNAARGADAAIVSSNRAATNQIRESSDRALAQFRASIERLVPTFTKGLSEMATGEKSFAQVLHGLGVQIYNDFLKLIDLRIEKWAWGVTENVLASRGGQAFLDAIGATELAAEIARDAKKTASKQVAAVAQKSVLTIAQNAGLATDLAYATAEKAINADVAYSGAIAAISPIPFIGPFIAPEIAAEMAMLASASGGFDIPAGVNPLTQLHAQEMVLPARLANPMRAMMDDYATSRGGPWGAPAQPAAASGDTHIHNYSVSTMDAGSFRSFLRSNKDPLSTVLQEMGRAGMRTA